MTARGAVWCAVSCAAALIAGCTEPADPPFRDKGRGVWQEMPGAPPMTYHAVWGADASAVYAVGDAGIAHFDGAAWRLLEGVPATTYRAVWARSPSEVWIGGDGALLARSLTGWQSQLLLDGDLPITEFSVLALGGDSLREYAVVLTGGKELLLLNQGSAWKTARWSGASGPPHPFPQRPSLFGHAGRPLVAGDGDLVECYASSEFGVSLWEAHRWRYDVDLPPLAAISGSAGSFDGSDFWVAAGGSSLVVYRAADLDPELTRDDRDAPRLRDARGVFATRANRFFVVGAPVELSRPDPLSGISLSPVEACDEDGCALERMDAAGGEAPLRAVWGTADGAAIAVGDGLIVERRSCGDRRCRLP